MRNKILIILLFVISGALGLFFSLYQHGMIFSEEEKVVLPQDSQLIQTFHYPALFVKQLKGDPDAGRKIFKEFCATCHAQQPQIDIRAPRIGDKKMWHALRQMGIPALLKITIDGAGAMPARGGCFECSDGQLKEAIKYILSQS